MRRAVTRRYWRFWIPRTLFPASRILALFVMPRRIRVLDRIIFHMLALDNDLAGRYVVVTGRIGRIMCKVERMGTLRRGHDVRASRVFLWDALAFSNTRTVCRLCVWDALSKPAHMFGCPFDSAHLRRHRVELGSVCEVTTLSTMRPAVLIRSISVSKPRRSNDRND